MVSEVNVLINHDEVDVPAARYAFTELGSFLRLKMNVACVETGQKIPSNRDTVHVFYGKDYLEDTDTPRINIPYDNSLFESKERYVVKSHGAVLLTAKKGPDHILTRSEKSALFHYDIISMFLYFLSRHEEHTDRRRDKWDCYSADFTELRGLNLLEVPVLDECAGLFGRILTEIFNGEFDPGRKWPEGKDFAVNLVHDVDQPFQGDMSSALRMAKIFAKSGRGLGTSFRLMAGALKGKIKRKEDPFFNLEKYMEMEGEFGFNSSFHFTAGEIRRPEFDTSYSINNSRIVQGIGRIREKGWGLGLHGSFYSSSDVKIMREEKKNIEKVSSCVVEGMTQHYLHFDVAKTWDILDECGFAYDCSLGYNEAIGFRAGTASPFKPYNIRGNKTYSFMEIPLAIMDSALFIEMELDPDAAILKSINILKEVAKHRGAISIIWHLRVLDDNNFYKWGFVYREILKWLKNNNAWVAKGEDIAGWCYKERQEQETI